MPNKIDLPPFLREDERACCDKKEESEQDHKPQGCVDSWEEKLREADNDYKIASAKTGKAKNAFDNATLWESKLKDWIDNADKADEKAQSVVGQLVLFEAVVKRLEKNSAHTVEGIEILLCLVKKVFDDVQDVVRVNASSEKQKRLLYALKRYIECSPELDEKRKQDALACIEPYEKNVTAVSGAQDELLKELLKTLSQANKVAAALGIPEDSDEKQNDLGLRWQIEDLLNRMTGKSNAKEKVDKCGCPCTDTPPRNPMK